jgi:hypothetical protein
VGSFLAISNSLPHSIRASLDLLVRASTSTALRFQQAGMAELFATCDGLHDLSHLYRSDDGAD